MPSWYVNVGGAQQKIKKPYVNVGGTWQLIKTGWINVGGVWQKFFSGEDDLVMVTGIVNNAVGFAQGSFGSLTPNVLGDGAVVNQLTISNGQGTTPHVFIFFINSYAGSIGSSYLTSIQVGANGIYTPQDSNFQGFTGGGAGGSAAWQWGQAATPGVGQTVPVIVIRSN